MGNAGKRHAFILGATGAVGQQLLRRLVESDKFAKIHAPTRRGPGVEHKKIIPHAFEEIYRPWKLDVQVSDFFYCFGSTLKSAGSQEEFRRIELSIAHEALLVAKQTGVKRFYLVSAQGVGPQSLIPYLRTKAEVEKILKNHSFQSFFLYRPSLLITAREELRVGELVAQRALRPMLPLLQRYLAGRAPVKVEQVAQAMLVDALKGEEGMFVRENRNIIELASLDSES
jgi:uncharacterized protein YbjT (DUF2867 family)